MTEKEFAPVVEKSSLSARRFWAVEGTRAQHGLTRVLQAAGQQVIEAVPPVRGSRRRGGKSDRLDAIHAARTDGNDGRGGSERHGRITSSAKATTADNPTPSASQDPSASRPGNDTAPADGSQPGDVSSPETSRPPWT